MNGAFFLNAVRVIITSGVLAAATALWSLNRQVAVLEERISQVLTHSDKRDEVFDSKMRRIEQRLDELKR